MIRKRISSVLLAFSVLLGQQSAVPVTADGEVFFEETVEAVSPAEGSDDGFSSWEAGESSEDFPGDFAEEGSEWVISSEEVSILEEAASVEEAPLIEEALPMEEASALRAGADEEEKNKYLIVNASSVIMSGLNSKGQIIAGKDVVFPYAYLLNLNKTLRLALEEGREVTVGTRNNFNADNTQILTPDEKGICRFSAPAGEGGYSYWITATITETGEVFESNTAFTVNPDPIVTLTIEVQGKGSIEASTYESTNGEKITLTITPEEGWFYDGLQLVSGDFNYPAGSDGTVISLYDKDTVVKAIFREIGTYGKCGEDAIYEFDKDTGVMTITGTGKINDNAFDNSQTGKAPWDALKALVIGEGITEIGYRAFVGCENMESVTLPMGLEKIDTQAFQSCKKLTGIEFPESLTEIGKEAFLNCYGLASVDLPDSLTTLGNAAFMYTGLKTVTVPESVVTMDTNVFNHCESLTSAKVEAKFNKLPNAIFSYCYRLTEVSLPDTLEEIGYCAFNYCTSLKTVSLPDGLKKIDEAFSNCSSLTDLTIPDTVSEMTAYTFLKCTSLTTIRLPESLTELKYDTFSGCKRLASVTLPDGLTKIGDRAFNDCSALTQLQIPSGVGEIEYGAFSGCSSLTRIDLPDSLSSLPEAGFQNCTALTDVTNIPSHITEIPDSCFYGCTALTSVPIPAGVKEIGWAAFKGCGLTSLTLPAALETIETYGFEYTKLTGTLTIPAGVKTIGPDAFYGNDFSTIINHSEVTIAVSDLLTQSQRNSGEGYLDSAGKAVTELGKGTYTRKVTVANDPDSEPVIVVKDPEPVIVVISPVDIKTAAITIAGAFTYTGADIQPVPVVKLGTVTLRSGTDYTVSYKNNRNVGTATVTITGKGDYTGTASKTFQIHAASISGAAVAKIADQTYTGKAMKKAPVVKAGSTVLKSGTDYTVAYKNNKNVGTATVTITGKGNYTGSKKVTFLINPKGTTLSSLSKASKAATVKWKKQSAKMASSRITGYQIQFATDSKFTKNKKTVTVSGYSKTSQKVTKLKGKKKYYVRIRTYKKVSGKTYYSSWSKAKTVTTKK